MAIYVSETWKSMATIMMIKTDVETVIHCGPESGRYFSLKIWLQTELVRDPLPPNAPSGAEGTKSKSK